MKRILGIALAAILLMLGYSFAAADGMARLHLSTDISQGNGGDIVTLSLSLTAENLGGMQTTIRWNEGYLTYVEDSAAYSDDFADSAALSMINDTAAGSIRLVYGNTEGYTAENEAVFSAQFRLSDDVSGDTTFSFDGVKLTDASSSLAAMEFETVEATVTTPAYYAGNVYLYLNSDHSSPRIGDVVTVSMHVDSSDYSVGSLQGTVSYDTEVFEYVNDSAVFSDAASDAAFTQDINANTPGMLKFAYGSLEGCPNGTLMTAQFKVIGDRQSYSYICLSDAMATNTETGRLSKMDCYTSDAFFSIQKHPEVLYYTAKIDESGVYNGETITLKISAEGITLGGFQATLSYNPDELEYVEGSGAFTDAFADKASISMVNDATAGAIKLIYSSTEGFTPDGGDIFTAQFSIRRCGVDFEPIVLAGIKTTNASADE